MLYFISGLGSLFLEVKSGKCFCGWWLVCSVLAVFDFYLVWEVFIIYLLVWNIGNVGFLRVGDRCEYVCFFG